MVVFAPPTVNAAGFSTPFVPSAPTAVPMATGIEERLVQQCPRVP